MFEIFGDNLRACLNNLKHIELAKKQPRRWTTVSKSICAYSLTTNRDIKIKSYFIPATEQNRCVEGPVTS